MLFCHFRMRLKYTRIAEKIMFQDAKNSAKSKFNTLRFSTNTYLVNSRLTIHLRSKIHHSLFIPTHNLTKCHAFFFGRMFANKKENKD